LNFSCDHCGRKYSIADDRVGDKGVKIRCKHCQNVILVKPPPVIGAEESTRMVSLDELERGGVAAPRSSPAGGSKKASSRAQRTEVAPAPTAPTSSSSSGASPWEGEATRAVVAPDPNAQWFAMVKGQQVGPFDLRGLSGKVKTFEVSLKTFVWREGMDDWKRAEELPELALMFAGGMAKEESRASAAKMEAVKSIAAALQKSAAAGMRSSAPREAPRPGEPVEEPKRIPVAEASPDEMWPGETGLEEGNGLDGLPDEPAAPLSFDLSVDAPNGSDTTGPGLELDLEPATSAASAAAEEPIPEAEAEPEPEPEPAPAPAMSSAAAVTVSPHPPRGKRKMPKLEPTPPPRTEPPPEAAAPPPADFGSDLFSDLDLRRSGEKAPPLDPGDLTRTADEPPPNGAGGDADPFSRMGAAPAEMLPKPGQATSYVIAQAGVARRNPVWKVLLFVVLLVGVPVGVLYALSEMNVVPLQVTHVDQATGQTVSDPVFSRGGVSGLRDLLMGKKPPAAPKQDGRDQDAPPRDGKDGKEKGPASAAKTGEPTAKQLQDLYQDGKKKDVGPAGTPKVGANDAREHDEPVGGPPKEEINKVVEATQRAFQFCIEQELKKNPGFRGGKVKLVATVGASGVVKKASIDREDINQSDLGECLKGKAKRMSFSAFSGDDVDLEIPLILSTAM
jgi:predicted Zn finger-like uncharacterized protein